MERRVQVDEQPAQHDTGAEHVHDGLDMHPASGPWTLVTDLGLAAASAGAPPVPWSCTQERHDLIGETPLAQEPGHDLHRPVDVAEIGLVPGAQVVQPRLPVGCQRESILRTLAVAGKPHVAASTVGRKRVAFGRTEGALLGRRDQFHDMGVLDVAQEVVGLDEVVARVDVTIVFECHRVPTGFGKHAHPRGDPVPGRQGCIELLDVDVADIANDPFIEDGDEELPPLRRVRQTEA